MSKVYTILAKRYRGVLSHDTEKWCKILRKTNLLFEKFGEFGSEHWKALYMMTLKNDEKFKEELTCRFKMDEFWPKHLRVLKVCSFMGSFWPKYKMFEKCNLAHFFTFFLKNNHVKKAYIQTPKNLYNPFSYSKINYIYNHIKKGYLPTTYNLQSFFIVIIFQK